MFPFLINDKSITLEINVMFFSVFVVLLKSLRLLFAIIILEAIVSSETDKISLGTKTWKSGLFKFIPIDMLA